MRSSSHAAVMPAAVRAARELRDRWMEAVRREPGLLATVPGAAALDVSRVLPAGACPPVGPRGAGVGSEAGVKRVENTGRRAA